MWIQALITVLGAVLSSALTLGLAYAFFEKHYKLRLQRELDEQVEDYLQRFRALLDEEVEKVEKVGMTIETRVRKGVLDAVAALPSSEVIQGTAQSAVQTGVDLVETGLQAFLGTKPRKK